ncbi:hypothetical protein [Cyanobium sp. A2C-AMD]|uniref:hypothetical protein n=1 Tax=Cyanobium sp. A2C-AMD TaxID=2823695 RepID=UPI0020CD003F|nr:hypothetical protein [Cyanobium sp. A2C-AMD]MCP9876025.1 hypothetical protein [Cyanobium sp. A2C-AMD]
MSRDLEKLSTSLDLFRTLIDKDLPVQVVVILLFVAIHDGCLQQDIFLASGMSEGSVSRCLDWLGHEHRSGKPGLKLIRKERDAEYYKRWRVFLTPKGQSFVELLKLTMED